jgi:hypothetical protein
MIASILRLFALRPLFSIMVFGFPLLLLAAVGFLTILAFKTLFLIVLPVVLVVWVVRRLMGPRGPSSSSL